jgi:8-oxo-dGTP diphosphatase
MENVVLYETKEVSHSASSGALVKCGNELIMYQRDNKPDIPHPGKLAIFGGIIEDGLNETPIEALIREISEKLNIKIDPKQIKYKGLLVAGDDQDHDKHISLVEITPQQKNAIKKGSEGKKIVFFTPDKLPDQNEMVPDLKLLLVENRNTVKSWLNGSNVIAEDLGLRG